MEYHSIHADLATIAHKIELDVYKLTSAYPPHELMGLISQFRRAAVSVAANLAEGYRKRSVKDKLRVYNIALCSLAECQYFLRLSKDLSYAHSESLAIQMAEFSKRLYQYCSAIERNSMR